MGRARSNGKPVPGVDHGNGDRKIRQLLVGKLSLHLFVYLIGGMRLGDVGQIFRPGEGGSLAI